MTVLLFCHFVVMSHSTMVQLDLTEGVQRMYHPSHNGLVAFQDCERMSCSLYSGHALRIGLGLDDKSTFFPTATCAAQQVEVKARKLVQHRTSFQQLFCLVPSSVQ